MALQLKQSVIITSKDIFAGAKLQAIIQEIVPDHITLHIPLENLEIALNTDLIVSFWDEHSTYEFQSRTVTRKSPDLMSVQITRPSMLTKTVNRSFPRATLNATGSLQKEDEREKEKCQILDVSVGGARIQAQAAFNVQNHIKINLDIPGKNFYNLPGVIVWKKDLAGGVAEYGVQFGHISIIRRNELSAYIQSKLSETGQE